MLFLGYNKCSTCRKAKKFLNEKNIEFIDRDIIEEKPTRDELKKWIDLSGLEIKKFFNTSGVMYKELKLKDKVKEMNAQEMIDLLSTDGRLVKRPILVMENRVLVGFKEEEYRELI